MKIIGHRGAKGLAPENTLESFTKAIEYGVDEIEFDVRVSKDGVPVLSHDPSLRINNNHFRIANHTYAELREAKEHLPTLGEALDYIKGRTPVLVEVKPHEPLKPIIKVIEAQLASGTYGPHNLLLASFSQATLRELHARFPAITMVVNERWSGVRGTYRARQLDTKRITMRSWWLWSGFISSIAHGGYQLSSYVINNPTKAKRWAKAGLYAVVTDYPDKFTSSSSK